MGPKVSNSQIPKTKQFHDVCSNVLTLHKDLRNVARRMSFMFSSAFFICLFFSDKCCVFSPNCCFIRTGSTAFEVLQRTPEYCTGLYVRICVCARARTHARACVCACMCVFTVANRQFSLQIPSLSRCDPFAKMTQFCTKLRQNWSLRRPLKALEISKT